MDTPTRVIWVYDVLSPFAYLSLPRLKEFTGGVTLEARPVLLGALLDHFGQRGPAEISAKRRFTYRFALWRARRLGCRCASRPRIPSIPWRRCG